MPYLNDLRVVVIEPSAAGNVGWIARAMANFGAHELVLVNPSVFDLKLARDFSCHGASVIDSMRPVNSLDDALSGIPFVVGTTRRISGSEPFLGVRQAAPVIADRLAAGRAAIVFGRESSGLSKEEKAKCSLLASIDTVDGPKGSLNISHAAALFFYEIAEALKDGSAREGADISPAEETFDRALSSLPGYVRGGVFQKALHSVLSRAHPTAQEVGRLASAFALLGRKGDMNQ